MGSASQAALAALIASLPEQTPTEQLTDWSLSWPPPAPVTGPVPPPQVPAVAVLVCGNCGQAYTWQTAPPGYGGHCSMACADASTLRRGSLSKTAQERPPLDVGNPAVATEWLRVSLGAGPLAGMFARGVDIVHTPREGEDGYVPLTDEDRDDDGPAQVRPIRPDGIAARVQHTHYVYRLVKRDDDYVPVPALFPVAAARMVAAAPDMVPNLRRLAGVVHSPVLRADGSVLDKPGYDKTTRLLHLPDPGLVVPPVPERPTAGEVKTAVALLDEMTAGFPFVSDHDRANYYGLLLTPLLRNLVPPPYKLFNIGAPQQGSGKSLLEKVARILHGGVFRAEMPEDEAELRKQVTTILSVTTGPVVVFDNVKGVLDSSVLAGLLTSADWDDRKLGVNEMVSALNDRVWTVTANNLLVGLDQVRRTVWVTIDPGMPNPHLRTGFAIEDLEGWARQHRGGLLAALLTLIRAWVAAGRPVEPARASDGYARWIRTVDGILTHAGVPGRFADPESARQETGEEDDEWGEFLAAVHAVFGERSWAVKELLDQIHTGDLINPRPIPLDALPGQLVEKATRSGAGVQAVARSLGRWLKHRDGRYAGSLCIRAAGVEHKQKMWKVVPLSPSKPGGDRGFRGFNSATTRSGENRSTTQSNGTVESVQPTGRNKPPIPPKPPSAAKPPDQPPLADLIDRLDTGTTPPPPQSCRVCGQPLDPVLAERWHRDQVHPRCLDARSAP